MQTAVRKILVVGGNGFIGSAICRAALAKGMEVTSVSSSGRPYVTPNGHSPAWTSKVTWLKGDALDPSTFSGILSEVDGVAHSMGTLIEDGGVYKAALKERDVRKLVGGFFSGVMDNLNGTNPLSRRKKEGSYENLNRDSALRVCKAFIQYGEGKKYPSPRPFVFLSAEDLARPIVPSRYIETKREAEQGIESLVSEKPELYRGVYIRPSIVYHAHYRPLTTPIAAIFDLSATLHTKIPNGIPKPAEVIRQIGNALSPRSVPSEGQVDMGSSLESVANVLSIPPVHVDHVGEAVAVALQSDDVRGVVGVSRIRELIGWRSMGSGSM
ncbi:mitochondrial protein [Marasmius fiardii PR-910]|nr:mitochondrial protein [Marasmius fiardii PR-910]